MAKHPVYWRPYTYDRYLKTMRRKYLRELTETEAAEEHERHLEWNRELARAMQWQY